MRIFLHVIGGLAIVLSSFFGTLWITEPTDTLKFPDSVRAEHAKQIKTALEKYHTVKGAYPFPFPDNPLSDLKPALVDTGFLKAIPEDATATAPDAKQYRYVSTDGKSYGLLLRMKLGTGSIPAGGSCVTGVGSSGNGWWLNAADCPF